MLKKQEIHPFCWINKQFQLASSLTKIGENILTLLNIITSGILTQKKVQKNDLRNSSTQ